MLDFLKKNKPFPFFQWSVYFFSVCVDTKASVLNVRIKELKAQGHTATEDNIKANIIPKTLSPVMIPRSFCGLVKTYLCKLIEFCLFRGPS